MPTKFSGRCETCLRRVRATSSIFVYLYVFIFFVRHKKIISLYKDFFTIALHMFFGYVDWLVVFLFNIVIYVFLLKKSMYSCILIVRPCILNVVHVFLLLSIYSYCSSMYSYRCLCILIVVHIFLDATTLTEVFPCFFFGCKANARV